MSDAEEHLIHLETQAASVSGSVFGIARLETLASGQCVLSTENGVIYRVTPEGGREEVKRISPPVAVEKGAKVQLR